MKKGGGFLLQDGLAHRAEIADGVFLTTLASDLYKTNYLHIYFLFPLSVDSAAKSAVLAHLLCAACEKYPSFGALRRAFSELYNADISCTVTAVGETQVLDIGCAFLKDRYALFGERILEQVLSFCREILLFPYLENGVFSEAVFAGEQKNAADDARAILNDKGAYARSRLIANMCAREPYAADPMGDPARIEALTPKEVYDFFCEMQTSARTEIFFVGEPGDSDLNAAATGLFSSLSRIPAPPLCTLQKKAPAKPRQFDETLPLEQAHLCLGFRTGIARADKRYPALALMNVLYGGSASSKLFMNVREKLSLCYTVQSYIEAQKGLLQVYCGIEKENRKEAFAEILAQLGAVQAGEFDKTEFARAKSILESALRSVSESPDRIAAWLLPRLLFGGFATPEEESAAIGAVTEEQLCAAARTIKLDTVYFLSGDAK